MDKDSLQIYKNLLIKNFIKPTIPEASYRGILPVSFWLNLQNSKFFILPHPELQKSSSDHAIGMVKAEMAMQSIAELFR